MCVCVCVCVWCTCVCLRPCARVSECAYISFSNRAWCRALQFVRVFFSVLQFVKLQLPSTSDTGRIIWISQTQWGMQCVAAVLQFRNILSACALYVQYSQYIACWGKGWTAFSTMTIIATHCNTLQHTATHCNILQHTETHTLTALKTLFVNHTVDKEARYSYVPPGILMYVAVCCSMLQCNAACWSVLKEAQYSYVPPGILMCDAVCCSVMQRVAVYWRRHGTPMFLPVSWCMLQCIAVALQCMVVCCSVLPLVVVFWRRHGTDMFLPVFWCVLQCVAVMLQVLQYGAVCCSVLQCVAGSTVLQCCTWMQDVAKWQIIHAICTTLHHTTA